MSIEDSPVYVIGHYSPDSHLVCSAITYDQAVKVMKDAHIVGTIDHHGAGITQ